MKIRLVQESMRDYSGYLGDVYFEGGVSVDHVAPTSAHRLAVIMPIETINGEDPSPLTMMHDLHHVSCSNVGEVMRGKMESFEADSSLGSITVDESVEANPVNADVKSKLFTREELEAIADKGGISALRDMAEPHGIKARSISELIEELLVLQA